MTAVGEYQPLYVAWCRATGQTPGHTSQPLYEYTIWICKQWSIFDAETGRTRDHYRSDEEIAGFAAWLNNRPVRLAAIPPEVA